MMVVQVRQLNELGIREMREFHHRIHKEGSSEDPPYFLLDDDEYSIPFELSGGTTFAVDESLTFALEKDVGEYMCDVFDTPERRADVLENQGVGAWLALRFFESICQRTTSGTWRAREEARYIPNSQPRRFYRHLIFSPMLIVSTHGEGTRLLLHGPANKISEFRRHLSEYSEIVLNPEMLKVLDHLYWSEDLGIPMPTATNHDPIPDGGLRRFIGPGSFTFQHGPTWDFWELSAEQILALLPPEFDSWKNDT